MIAIRLVGYLSTPSSFFALMDTSIFVISGKLSFFSIYDRYNISPSRKAIYYINTNEIPGELSRENLISSHVKITCYLHM